MNYEAVAAGDAALLEGRWADARAAFEAALANDEAPDATFGLANALWWLGDSLASAREAARAYVLFRRAGDVSGAIRSAVWLNLVYKADFANYVAANGWLGRAERLLTGVPAGPLHGWVSFARGHLSADLQDAEELTREAVRIARDFGDPDLELCALSQLGKIRIGRGEVTAGFALIDEAMAAALAGERTTLDTVVYTGCDMLTACELANDLERAEQWCRVADDFVQRFGCPYLYAECRIYYGSVLTAKGRWADAERELLRGIRTSEGADPGLHARARTRLAVLRIRQGRLEEAAALVAQTDPDANSETEATLSRAALELARGNAPSARRVLERDRKLIAGHRTHLGTALGLLVESCLDGGDLAAAERAAGDLSAAAATAGSAELDALAADARGRVAAAAGDTESAETELRTALESWSRLHQPFHAARARLALGRTLSDAVPDGAIDYLRQALDDFTELGAALEADRAAGELRALGVASRPGPRGVGVLTEREQQVLRLVAAGLSNPEIAARLHVSRKTAAHHVSHILTKLNLRNRVEAVAYATGGVGAAPAP